MKMLFKLLVSSTSVFVTAYLVPGVALQDFTTAIIVAVVLGVLNIFLKPILVILTIPINILTLGLFTLVINVGLIMLAAHLVDGFTITGLLTALIFGLVMSFVNSFLNTLTK